MGLENPCFCIPLKRGAFVIACLEIAFGIIGALLSGVAIVSAKYLESHPNASVNNTNVNNTSVNATSSTTSSEVTHVELSWIYVVLSLFLIYMSLSIAFGFILAYGIKRDKLILLKVWLGFKITGVVWSLATFVAFIFLQESATIKPTIFDGVSFIFSLYCILVVYTVAADIKKQITGPVKPFRT